MDICCWFFGKQDCFTYKVFLISTRISSRNGQTMLTGNFDLGSVDRGLTVKLKVCKCSNDGGFSLRHHPS
jgi:hypothetical protein